MSVQASTGSATDAKRSSVANIAGRFSGAEELPS